MNQSAPGACDVKVFSDRSLAILVSGVRGSSADSLQTDMRRFRRDDAAPVAVRRRWEAEGHCAVPRLPPCDAARRWWRFAARMAAKVLNEDSQESSHKSVKSASFSVHNLMQDGPAAAIWCCLHDRSWLEFLTPWQQHSFSGTGAAVRRRAAV